jgi:group I intron endonuclease
MENCGVYKITNIVNDKCYIGSSKNIKKRWYEHKRRLRKGIHHSQYLQKSFNKYGENNFVFEMLDYCEPDELLVIEQQYFDEIKPEYIILKIAGRVDGYRHTEETKARLREISKNQKRKPCSDETKIKISEANKGKIFTDEHKEKLSKAHLGKTLSDEHKSNIKIKTNSEVMRQKQELSVVSRLKNKKRLNKKRCEEISNQNSIGLIGLDSDGNKIYEFNSHREAYEMLGVSESTLWRMLNSDNYKNRKYKNITWIKKG